MIMPAELATSIQIQEQLNEIRHSVECHNKTKYDAYDPDSMYDDFYLVDVIESQQRLIELLLTHTGLISQSNENN